MNVTVSFGATYVNGMVTVDNTVVNGNVIGVISSITGTVISGSAGGGAPTVKYYDIKILNNTFYTWLGLDIPDLSLYTLKSVNASLKVFCDGIKFWWNDQNQNFSDQYIQNGNTLEFLYEVGRIEIEFTNKLILR